MPGVRPVRVWPALVGLAGRFRGFVFGLVGFGPVWCCCAVVARLFRGTHKMPNSATVTPFFSCSIFFKFCAPHRGACLKNRFFLSPSRPGRRRLLGKGRPEQPFAGRPGLLGGVRCLRGNRRVLLVVSSFLVKVSGMGLCYYISSATRCKKLIYDLSRSVRALNALFGVFCGNIALV